MEGFEHGATDSGAHPLADFSTCAHPLGPCPEALRAVECADRTRYPDPEYAALRAGLATRHGVSADRVVVGCGASELVHRCVRAAPGDVLGWDPTFVEYRRAAVQEGRRYLSARTREEWLAAVPERGTAFLCQPNNPDGLLHDPGFLDRAARECSRRGCSLVVDLAYAEFRTDGVFAPDGADLLRAPNKVMGLVGVRAGYLVCSDPGRAAALRRLEPSWILSTEGVAFLESSRSPGAADWIRGMSGDLAALDARLRSALSGAGWETLPGDSHFAVHRPPPGAPSARRMRERGIRIRDLGNVGLPGWFRLSARPVPELELLEGILSGRD